MSVAESRIVLNLSFHEVPRASRGGAGAGAGASACPVPSDSSVPRASAAPPHSRRASCTPTPAGLFTTSPPSCNQRCL